MGIKVAGRRRSHELIGNSGIGLFIFIMGEENISPKRLFSEYWTRFRRENGKLTPPSMNYKLFMDDYGHPAADHLYNYIQYASRPSGIGEEALTDEQRKYLHEAEEGLTQMVGVHPKEIIAAKKEAKIENL